MITSRFGVKVLPIAQATKPHAAAFSIVYRIAGDVDAVQDVLREALFRCDPAASRRLRLPPSPTSDHASEIAQKRETRRREAGLAGGSAAARRATEMRLNEMAMLRAIAGGCRSVRAARDIAGIKDWAARSAVDRLCDAGWIKRITVSQGHWVLKPTRSGREMLRDAT